MALMINRGVSMLSLVVLLAVIVNVATSASLPSLSLPSIVPAFVWSNHRQLDLGLPSISYQTVSSEDFVEKVKGEFVGPTTESAQHQHEEDLDVVVVFVGTKLRSEDISRVGGTSDLVKVLNRVIASSNSSVSLPYVMQPGNGASVSEMLVKEIAGDVEENGESRVGEVITTGACVNKNAPQAKRLSLSVLQEYLRTRLGGKTDLVVVCGGSEGEESVGSKSLSEGEVLEGILLGLDEMKTRYVALYTTDLSGERAFVSKRRGRQLGSVVYEGEEYCNEVCQTKAFILEGVLVGLTLLIILISGLCCMSGITTPVRFEQNKDGQ